MRTSWEALHGGLTQSLRSFETQNQFSQWRAQSTPIPDFEEPAELLAFLHGSGDLDVKDGCLRALVTWAQTPSPTGSLLVSLSLWPGLDAVFRRVARQWTDDDLASALWETFLMQVRRLPLARVSRVAATLVWNTERELRTVLDRQRRGAAAAEEAAEADDSLPPIRCSHGELVAALTRLVGPDAELLVGTHLLGMTHRELADRYGLSVEVVKKRCQRANSKIRHELQDVMSQVDVPECI